MIARYALIATLGFLGAAFAQGAQAAAPSGPQHFAGTVTAIDSSGVTLKANDGTETKLAVGPGVAWLAARAADREEIKPGKVVVTGARTQPDGTQHSYGFRLVEPGSQTFGPSGGPVAPPGATVTNGKITKVSKTAAGHEIDIAYEGGTRRVLLPPQVQVVSSFPAERSLLKVGTPVHALAVRGADGTLNADMVVAMLPGSQARPQGSQR